MLFRSLKDGKETYSVQTESGKRLDELRASIKENSEQIVDEKTGYLRDLTDKEKERKTTALLLKEHTGTKANFLQRNYTARLKDAESTKESALSKLEFSAEGNENLDITEGRRAINEQFLSTKRIIDANFIKATSEITTLDVNSIDLDKDGIPDVDESL